MEFLLLPHDLNVLDIQCYQCCYGFQVGCDTYAYLNGVLNGEPFSIGCLSKCTNNTHNIVNGTCSGIGCCQIDIPTGLRDINFATYSFNSHKEVWSVNPCSFAFIIQRDEFNFSSAYLTSLQSNRTLPMVLVSTF